MPDVFFIMTLNAIKIICDTRLGLAYVKFHTECSQLRHIIEVYRSPSNTFFIPYRQASLPYFSLSCIGPVFEIVLV